MSLTLSQHSAYGSPSQTSSSIRFGLQNAWGAPFTAAYILNILFEVLELDCVQAVGLLFYGSRITHLDVMQGSRIFTRHIWKNCSEIADQTKTILLFTTR